MTDNSTVQDLVTAISDGRACLLLGQDHTEGLVGSVTTEASSLASTPVASLKEALGRLDQLRSCRFLKVATHPSSDSASARPLSSVARLRLRGLREYTHPVVQEIRDGTEWGDDETTYWDRRDGDGIDVGVGGNGGVWWRR